MMTDFLLEIMKSRRQWNSTFKRLKEKNANTEFYMH